MYVPAPLTTHSTYLDMSMVLTSDPIVIYEIHLQTPTTALSRKNRICREVLVLYTIYRYLGTVIQPLLLPIWQQPDT